MCIYSAVGPAFDPVIPQPTYPWDPSPLPGINTIPWGPVPSTGMPIGADALKEVLDAFHKMAEAAKAADKAAGQPDCTDPDKIKLEARVAELERRLAEIAKSKKPSRKKKKAKRC